MIKDHMQMIKDTEIVIELGGFDNWEQRLKKLRYILKVCAPLKKSYPAYTFNKYYYVKDGRWYGSTQGIVKNIHSVKMDVLDIGIPYTEEIKGDR